MIVWLLALLLLCLDLLLIWWMYKSGKSMRRFALLPVFVVFILPFFNQPPILDSVLLQAIGIALATIGCGVMASGGYEFHKRGIISALSAKESSKKGSEVRHELVTSGIYGVFRHPQYVGLLLFLVGYYLAFNAVYALSFAPLLVVWFLVVAFVEEKYDLELLFGEAYKKYKDKVGMFFPKISR